MGSQIVAHNPQLDKIKSKIQRIDDILRYDHTGNSYSLHDNTVSILEDIVEYLESQMQVSPTVTCDGIYPPGTK